MYVFLLYFKMYIFGGNNSLDGKEPYVYFHWPYNLLHKNTFCWEK